QEVEGDEPGRRGLGEHAYSRFGRMHTLLEGAEVEAVRPGDDQLPVQDQPGRTELPEGRQDLRKIARHRAPAPAHQGDLIAVPEDQGPEAVPLGLVLPGIAL